MARRSILTSVRAEGVTAERAPENLPEETAKPVARVKPNRRAKLHIGGYYDPQDPNIIAFQKLGIDLRKSQQEMLLEALRDFVAKHQVANAFNKAARRPSP
ncbi:MAG TPA: hypothetical protein VI685_03445 [Candidatus Angelobacter sp.]